MKNLVIVLAIIGFTITGCSSSDKTPDGKSLVVVKHKKYSSKYIATKIHKHESQATKSVDNLDS
jgi:uncharacterized protein YceK